MIKNIQWAGVVILILLCSVLFPFSSFSDDSTQSTGIITLTPQQVENVLKILPYFLKNSNKTTTTPGSTITPQELNQLAVKNGFKNYQEFLKSASAIMMAYAYLQLKSNEAVLMSKISRLKPEVATTFQAQMHSLAKSIQAYEKHLSPDTVKAVIPYMSKIDEVLKTNK